MTYSVLLGEVGNMLYWISEYTLSRNSGNACSKSTSSKRTGGYVTSYQMICCSTITKAFVAGDVTTSRLHDCGLSNLDVYSRFPHFTVNYQQHSQE